MKKQKINQELVKKIMEKKGLSKSEAKAWLEGVILSNKQLAEMSGGANQEIDGVLITTGMGEQGGYG